MCSPQDVFAIWQVIQDHLPAHPWGRRGGCWASRKRLCWIWQDIVCVEPTDHEQALGWLYALHLGWNAFLGPARKQQRPGGCPPDALALHCLDEVVSLLALQWFGRHGGYLLQTL